jgi:hypothetical protein
MMQFQSLEVYIEKLARQNEQKKFSKDPSLSCLPIKLKMDEF